MSIIHKFPDRCKPVGVFKRNILLDLIAKTTDPSEQKGFILTAYEEGVISPVECGYLLAKYSLKSA